MAKKIQWHNEKKRIGDLSPYGKNPNINSDVQFNNLKKSLKNSGYAEIIVVDADNKIIAGNHRWKAMMDMKMADELIDVRIPDRKLTQKEFDRYLLASNAIKGNWDFEALKTFDTGLLLDIGFDENTLSGIFDDNLEILDDEFEEEVEIEKAKQTNIKPGDYFALGRHRLLCTNALDPDSAKKLMCGAQASMIDIDMPFNIGLKYDRPFGGKKDYGGKTNDNKSEAEYRIFTKTIMQNALSVAKPDAHLFFWCDERWVFLFQELYKELGVDSKRLCIWLKDSLNPTPQIAFSKVTEFCAYGVKGKPFLSDKVKNLHEIQNKEVTTGNRLTDDILDLLNIWLVKRLPGNEIEHPTQKPPTLHEKALRRCTRPGDIVLDTTCGSGSILSACEQLGRTAYVADCEPIFCQVAINRFKKISHDQIKKLN